MGYQEERKNRIGKNLQEKMKLELEHSKEITALLSEIGFKLQQQKNYKEDELINYRKKIEKVQLKQKEI